MQGREVKIEPINTSSDSDSGPPTRETTAYYNNDQNLPVFLWGMTQGMPTKDVVRDLLDCTDNHEVATAVPCNVQHNTAFVVDSWKLRDMWDIKCDDMGSWTNQGRKHFKKGSMDDNYDVYRQSYCNANLPSLKKFLVYLKNGSGASFRYMFVQYVFTDGETALNLKPHGNSKIGNQKQPYKRTMPSTMKAIREEDSKPREVMHAIIDDRGGIENIRNSAEYPRDRVQIYRARKSKSGSCLPATDPLIQLLQMSKEQQRGDKAGWFVRDVQLSNERTVFLANDQQLLDVERFCTNPELFSVFSVDATFNVAKHYFTFGTYRNLMLETQRGTNPVCVGPGVLHKRKLESSYYILPSSMVKYRPETRGVLVIGTDGEENISKALSNVFADAVHLRCDMHLKDNVKRKLSELRIEPTPARAITNDIFGCDLGGIKEGGLVDCTSEEEFDRSLKEIEKRWPVLHRNATNFLTYFLEEPAPVIRESM